ncbi:hypothetical protein WMY93_015781 [Mugilogobius chulae]|uniref:SAP domain-containing protein n=1 Tax=Mugilogobius chulae TaxID=88201 RepID=A0AAW0P171_9GOBI
MELQMNTTIHHNTIRRAFFQYSALTAYNYDYSCNRCGHHPPVLIADANWKLAFDVPVSVLKRPQNEDVQNLHLSINIKTKWEKLEKRLIASGICEELGLENPFHEDLDFTCFVPWIGPSSRISDNLPKTEKLKGLVSKSLNDTGGQKTILTEDELIQLLESKKPSKSELEKACSYLGLSTVGSESDLINRLEEMLLYKDIYPKMFVKLQKTGGGVLHMGCTHGVTYYSSPLLWQESARDHVDGLLSFRCPPMFIFLTLLVGWHDTGTTERSRVFPAT